MPRLGDKYIAGFLDADGSIYVQVSATGKPQVRIDFSQMADQDEVIHRIHGELDVGSIYDRATRFGTRYLSLSIGGSAAIGLLNRIGQHLVIKRHFAEVVVDLAARRVGREEIPTVMAYLKQHRMMRSAPLPVHPSRGWTAGYLDGDGCFSVSRLTEFGRANLVLHVAGDYRKTEGIELLCKAHGGNLYDMAQGRCKQWVLHLDPSKIKAWFPDLAKRMVVKADQVSFLLGCAMMGHLRDGENIRAGLKYLKARPHRLNEPKVDISAQLTAVRDLPAKRRSDYGEFVRNEHGRITGKRPKLQSESASVA